MTNDVKIKISELTDANGLSDFKLKGSYVPIVIDDENYKLKLEGQFYNKNEIDSKLNALKIYISDLLNGIEIPDDYDDSMLTSDLQKILAHLMNLTKGSCVDNTSTDEKLDATTILNNYPNILYNSLASNRVLITNTRGKINASDISVEELNALKGWDYKNEAGETLSLKDKIIQLENTIEDLKEYIRINSSYHGSTYTSSEELSMDNTEYIAKNDGILSVIPYYSHSAGRFNIYVNGTFITQSYQCYGDGHSHSGCCIPVKKNDLIKFEKTGGKQSKQKAYLIY